MIKSDKRLLEGLTKKYGVRGLNKAIQQINEAGHMYGKFDDGTRWTNSTDTWRGVKGTRLIDHGEWSDAEIWYDGEEINATDLEQYCWESYLIDCESIDYRPTESDFDNLPTRWFKQQLDDYMYDNFGVDA